MNKFKHIRKFNKNDIDRVIQIWYSSNLDTYNFIDKTHWKSLKDTVKSKFLNSNIYLYEENNIIKAFILINQTDIDALYVEKEHRSNGIGKKLLDFAKLNNNELSLNVFKKNVNAIRFYQKNGFKIIEENLEDSTKEKGYFMKWTKF